MFISIVIGIPSVLMFIFPFCFFTALFLSMPFTFNWLINNKSQREENMEMLKLAGHLLAKPFVFLYVFILGNNPFTETEC